MARPRLHDRLNGAKEAALTLVSAPAGFGKTTLVTEWLASLATPAAAWVSLDARDNDPALFWRYVVASLGLSGDEAFSQVPLENVVDTLVNSLQALAHPVVLVLDDYHVIDAPEVHDGVARLLERRPPQLHLVLTSRADPALPLARLRARGDLVEVRAADLRFRADEAAAYLNEVMGLALTAADVAALEGRTEGWIAALQLAALALQGRDDVEGYIAGFAGDDRYIVDYLVGEVLERQPDHVRTFLLRTSILSRLGGPLCDAVTGLSGGRATLETLDRGNLFVVALDDRRQWYRYHHLFADVLRVRLEDEQPDEVGVLHRRAAAWHQRQGDQPEAIRHALAGHAFDVAADLIELAAPSARQARQEATLRRWLEALPGDLFARRPVLAMARVGVLMSMGEFQRVEAGLEDLERQLERPVDAVVANHEEFGRLPAQVAFHRSGQALFRGDMPATIAHARRALALAVDDDHLSRGACTALIALASWTNGDLAEADRLEVESIASLERGGYLADTMGCALALGDIRVAQGRLSDAMATFERHLRPALRGAADMHVGMAEIHRERNELDEAEARLGASRELGEHGGLPQNAYRWRVALARIREARGDLDGALDLLVEAERHYVSDFFPAVRPVAAMTARLRLVRGEVGDAARWVGERGVSASDELSYLHEYEHFTLARVLLATGATNDAGRLLERLLAAAEEGGRSGAVVEALALLALVHQAAGDAPAALATLKRSLTLAEGEGYVRVFLDEGRPMANLLRAAGTLDAGPAKGPPPHRRDLVEPLSDRERHVLRLLRSELSGPEIARELSVSLNTMRSHTKNIFTKLGVTSRRAAVRRADELGL